jgi:hypothetical protein
VHTHRRSRSRVLGALAVLVASAAGLTACASGTATGTSSAPPVVSSSPSGGITPGGPIISASPAPTTPGSLTPGGASSTKPAHGIPVSGYSIKGTVLTVYFFAGVCDKHGVTADQSQPGEVRVAVVVTQHAPTGQMCPMVITSQHASVDLGRPLDGRKVIDSSTGQAVPQQTSGGPVGSVGSN